MYGMLRQSPVLNGSMRLYSETMLMVAGLLVRVGSCSGMPVAAAIASGAIGGSDGLATGCRVPTYLGWAKKAGRYFLAYVPSACAPAHS